MNSRSLTFRVVFLTLLVASLYIAISSNLSHASTITKTPANVPTSKPDAMIALGTVDGVKTVKGVGDKHGKVKVFTFTNGRDGGLQ